MANSVDPDQMLHSAVWSGSTLFAKAYLSQYLGILWYLQQKAPTRLFGQACLDVWNFSIFVTI